MAKTNAERVADCIRKNYDRIMLNVPRGGKAELEKAARERGLTVTGLIVESIRHYCGIDLRKD